MTHYEKTSDKDSSPFSGKELPSDKDSCTLIRNEMPSEEKVAHHLPVKKSLQIMVLYINS